jgi:hypothetical protein
MKSPNKNAITEHVKRVVARTSTAIRAQRQCRRGPNPAREPANVKAHSRPIGINTYRPPERKIRSANSANCQQAQINPKAPNTNHIQPIILKCVIRSRCLTSRAQARGAKQREPRSGTASANGGWHRRLVRPKSMPNTSEMPPQNHKVPGCAVDNTKTAARKAPARNR